MKDLHANAWLLRRRVLGLSLYALGIIGGGASLAILFLLPPLFSPESALRTYAAMLVGASLALPASAVYLTVPRLLDRYDPEPWFALVGCFFWGAIAACGFSAVVNSIALHVGNLVGGDFAGHWASAVISAPIIEEFWKGLGVVGTFLFLRREFDGVVDGIIYATFTAIGFAATENLIYYQKAALSGQEMLAITVFMRGILSPWIHPLATALTGVGIGIARESSHHVLRWLAPIGGYGAAVIVHAIWNGSALMAEATGSVGGAIYFLTLPVWFAFVFTFLAAVVFLVRRRGRIIERFLTEEIALGNMTRKEVRLVCSPFGIFGARMRYGSVAARFIRSAARLAMAKWHATRAMKGNRQTISQAFIAPLRQELASLRQQLLIKVEERNRKEVASGRPPHRPL